MHRRTTIAPTFCGRWQPSGPSTNRDDIEKHTPSNCAQCHRKCGDQDVGRMSPSTVLGRVPLLRTDIPSPTPKAIGVVASPIRVRPGLQRAQMWVAVRTEGAQSAWGLGRGRPRAPQTLRRASPVSPGLGPKWPWTQMTARKYGINSADQRWQCFLRRLQMSRRQRWQWSRKQ